MATKQDDGITSIVDEDIAVMAVLYGFKTVSEDLGIDLARM